VFGEVKPQIKQDETASVMMEMMAFIKCCQYEGLINVLIEGRKEIDKLWKDNGLERRIVSDKAFCLWEIRRSLRPKYGTDFDCLVRGANYYQLNQQFEGKIQILFGSQP
jgi:hypothetical protein